MNINLAPGMNEIIIREGAAPKVLDPKAPVKMNINGTIGDRTDNFAQVVNSNLPESFTLSIPVFKGGDKENLEVETFAKIDGRNVAFVLMSPGAEETLETLRDTAIDKELEAIKEIAPEIAIIEI